MDLAFKKIQWIWLSKKFTFLFQGIASFAPLLVKNTESAEFLKHI